MNNSNEVKRTQIGQIYVSHSPATKSKLSGKFYKSLKSQKGIGGQIILNTFGSTKNEATDNAEFICKAVNEYSTLIEEKEYAEAEGKRLSEVATHWKNEYDKLKKDNTALLDALKPFINLADEVFKEGRYERNGILYAFNKAEITFEALRAAKEAGQKAESK